jgi:hypothetical protein
METKNTKQMTAKDEINHWDSILDEYETSIGLPKYNASIMSESELNHYLTMTRDEIEKLTPEDCCQIAYRLGQFSFHTQRTINREQARLDWADETIKSIIADEINNYKGYGFVEKSLQAIKHNDRASSLDKIKRYAKQRVDRLSYIANSINNLSNILINIQKNKVKHVS